MERGSGVYRIASPDIACERFDGEFVILDLDSGRYYSLSPLASVFMSGALEGFASAEMAEAAAVAGKAGRDEVEAFFEALVGRNLIVQDAGTPAGPTAAWRQELAAAEGALSVEAFDDLADIIRLDPIHEADEAVGWPVAKPAG